MYTHAYAHENTCACMTPSTRWNTDTKTHNLCTNMHTHKHTHVYKRIDEMEGWLRRARAHTFAAERDKIRWKDELVWSARVRIHSLQSAAHTNRNGSLGVLNQYDPTKARWEVKFERPRGVDACDTEALRPDNLTQCSHKTQDKFAIASMANKLLHSWIGAHTRVHMHFLHRVIM